ncbi:MAG TPA: SGNH/GDSL hydrolase family protein [Nitrospiraceae bacterium]|nr:SGNH/GDSL hydrolase family protein [Nitrospiraceae bacterium]
MDRSAPTDTVLLAAFYAGIMGLFTAFLAYELLDDQLGLMEKTVSLSGLVLGGSLCLIFFCTIAARARWRLHAGSRQAPLTIALGMITVGLLGITSELAVRLMEEATPEGSIVNDTILLPREWQRVIAHRRSLWERSSAQYGVFVFDDVLGWTVGANRQGTGPHGETYYSSREGLRTAAAGLSLAGKSARKIALIGDSYTFASDVNYEDSWGSQLERQLGSGAQVLNFGVPGYGIDQAYLRYERDVRAWHPDVVVLAVISHDLLRTTMVYYHIGFPGAQVPGAKPRLIVRDGRLVPVNLPLPRPESIFATTDVRNLPFIDYDRFYRPSEWMPHLYEFSHLLRLPHSWASQWRLGMDERLDEETVALNTVLLETFLRRVQEDGAMPVIVFLPSYTEYRDTGGRPQEKHLLGTQLLDRANLPYVNLLPCLSRMPESEDKFTTGWHYTPAANRIVAECLRVELHDRPLVKVRAHPAGKSYQPSATPKFDGYR